MSGAEMVEAWVKEKQTSGRPSSRSINSVGLYLSGDWDVCLHDASTGLFATGTAATLEAAMRDAVTKARAK